MTRLLIFLVISLYSSSTPVQQKKITYYIVRHAEKETFSSMGGNVPLSSGGKARAEALEKMLVKNNIRHIFSTNTIRTISTAQPLANRLHLVAVMYDTKDTLDQFIRMLKEINDGNVLIVGHSNTVDDIVNKLTGRNEIAGALSDSSYGDLFIVRREGNLFSYSRQHFGK